MDLKLLQKVLNDKDTRKEYFRHDFEMWESWYFRREQAPFHLDWNASLEWHNDILLVGFRWSGKTTKVQNYVAWCLLYAKEPYIIVQSYEDTLSSAWVREVAKILMNPAIVEDYGCIYPLNRKIEDLAKGGQSSFETTNGCKIESRGIGGTIRGANAWNKNGRKTRPTLLILDDIDVTKSVANERIIEQNYDKIVSETMGALDQTRRRVILLGNVINEDGVVPRFKRTFSGMWDIFWQPLIDESGDCVWPERFTNEVIDKLRSEGERAFGQNYLLIPFTWGDTIIKRTSIKYATTMPQGARMVIGIDPAFSEKTWTDEMGVAMTWHVGVNKYVQTMEGLSGTEKDEERFCAYVEWLYKKWNVAMVVVEENNGGLILARMLKKRNLSVMTKKAVKDKVTRLREYEGCFDRGEVFFLPGTEKGVEQLLSFPHWAHDDRVDALVYSFEKSGGIAFGRA